MRTYAATAIRRDTAALMEWGYPHVLVSFAYDKRRYLLDALAEGTTLLLDSGAFQCWTKGTTVDLDEYVSYARDALARFPDARLINLDVIPGKPDTPATRRQATDAAKRSAANAEQLRAAGFSVIEVYHLDEPIRVLEGILERRRPGEAVALGGLAQQKGGRGFKVKAEFCAHAFHAAHQDGKLPPFHGLGISPGGPIGGGRFPWGSVDCSSWATVGKYGEHVTRDGRRHSHGLMLTRSADMNAIYTRRLLDLWRRLDASYAELWERRGVKVTA